jgi:hypothetical protein
MASNTAKTWNRRDARRSKAGRKRKNRDARNSTPSLDQLFAACGEPGQALKK